MWYRAEIKLPPEAFVRTRIFQIDAFTDRLLAGNPAAVMLMDSYPDDAVMLGLAAENNLAETAFLVREGDQWRLRWFTPAVEVPLCGHATLASAAVVMERLETSLREVVFQSASGPLTARRTERGYVLDFPARPSKLSGTPDGLPEALGARVLQVWSNAFNYMAVLDSEETVRELTPEMALIARMDRPGVIVTAKGDGSGYDCVSRYFAPRKGIPEDPVTGAAHCMIAPYWAQRLKKDELKCFQASKRGGEMVCRVKGERVELEGSCVFYMEGEAELPV